jgi:hypothetical protein
LELGLDPVGIGTGMGVGIGTVEIGGMLPLG